MDTSTILGNLTRTVVQGDDYRAVDGRSFDLTAVGVCWPATLTNVKLLVFGYAADCGCADTLADSPVILDIDGAVIAGTSAHATVARFDVLRAETLKLALGVRAYQFEVKGLLASGSVCQLARGFLTVIGGGL